MRMTSPFPEEPSEGGPYTGLHLLARSTLKQHARIKAHILAMVPKFVVKPIESSVGTKA